ncbi:MAG: hypothetical protein Q9222_007157 [Ikaeria aurantiellina]
MSNLQAFLEKRAKIPADLAMSRDPEQNERIQARLSKLGIHRPLSGAVQRQDDNNDQIRSPPLSRQAVADRSRVATPAFNPQRGEIGMGTVGNQPRDPRQAIDGSRGPINGHLPVRSQSRTQKKVTTAFDTDSEAFDETTGFSDLTNHVGFTFSSTVPKSNPAADLIDHSQEVEIKQDPLQQGFVDTIENLDPVYSPELDPDHNDGGDFNDGFSMEDGYGPEDTRPLNEAGQSDEKLNVNEIKSGQQRHGQHSNNFVPRRDRSLDDARSAHSNNSRPFSRESVRSDLTGSQFESELLPQERDEGSKTIHVGSTARKETNGYLLGQQISEPYLATSAKRKYSPDPGPQKLVHDSKPAILLSDQRNRSTPSRLDVGRSRDLAAVSHGLLVPKARLQKELDYEPKALASMSFHELANESFDTSPHPIDLKDPSLTDGSSLEKKLLYLHSLSGPKEQAQLQRQAFFSSLPIDQYEECGDLIAGHLSEIISKFKSARQQKRGIAKEFESEIATREKTVERRKVAVVKDLDRLRRAGQDVVRGQ